MNNPEIDQVVDDEKNSKIMKLYSSIIHRSFRFRQWEECTLQERRYILFVTFNKFTDSCKNYTARKNRVFYPCKICGLNNHLNNFCEVGFCTVCMGYHRNANFGCSIRDPSTLKRLITVSLDKQNDLYKKSFENTPKSNSYYKPSGESTANKSLTSEDKNSTSNRASTSNINEYNNNSLTSDSDAPKNSTSSPLQSNNTLTNDTSIPASISFFNNNNCDKDDTLEEGECVSTPIVSNINNNSSVKTMIRIPARKNSSHKFNSQNILAEYTTAIYDSDASKNESSSLFKNSPINQFNNTTTSIRDSNGTTTSLFSNSAENQLNNHNLLTDDDSKNDSCSLIRNSSNDVPPPPPRPPTILPPKRLFGTLSGTLNNKRSYHKKPKNNSSSSDVMSSSSSDVMNSSSSDVMSSSSNTCTTRPIIYTYFYEHEKLNDSIISEQVKLNENESKLNKLNELITEQKNNIASMEVLRDQFSAKILSILKETTEMR